MLLRFWQVYDQASVFVNSVANFVSERLKYQLKRGVV